MSLSNDNFALGKADVLKRDLDKTDAGHYPAHMSVQVRGHIDFTSDHRYMANGHAHARLFFLSSTLPVIWQ